MNSDNFTKQIEEIEALSAIYGSEWKVESEVSRSYSIRIIEEDLEVTFNVILPPEYPEESPPSYEFSAPWMDRKAKEKLRIALDEVYLNNVGETVIYQWIETIRDVLQNAKQTKKEADKQSVDQELAGELQEIDIKCPEIHHGEVIVDRKSSFQGHAAEVHSIEDVNTVLRKLKLNKKIAHAYHNMFAYRIERCSAGKSVILQDCDDDGENHAGGRMLHLLQVLDARNILVVVSRWYGGIQLGPDRFKHINNATRQVLVQAGFVKK